MGPRPLGRGNAADRRTCTGLPRPLQWGHGLSAVETIAEWGLDSAAVETLGVSLQWGHGLSAVENHLRYSKHQQKGYIASMGPRPVGHGTPVDARPMDNAGTLQWGHGLSAVEMHLPRRDQTARKLSFNGATASRPWKMRAGKPEPSPTRTRFNGATASRPWNELLALDLSQNDLRFNGATASRPWKPRVNLVRCRGDRAASMGPRPLGRGKIEPSRWYHPAISRFNGATASRPWKLVIHSSDRSGA